jgi:hypothetical protein
MLLYPSHDGMYLMRPMLLYLSTAMPNQAASMNTGAHILNALDYAASIYGTHQYAADIFPVPMFLLCPTPAVWHTHI